MESKQVGGCRCGTVRFEFASSRWCAHDYSLESTRALGAPATTWTGVRFDRFIITAGEDELIHYGTDDRTRSFCGRCGTTLSVRSGLWPEDVHVATRTIESPYRSPSANLFIDQRESWQPTDESLPGFGGANGRETIGNRSIRDTLDAFHPGVRVAARWDANAIRDLMYSAEEMHDETLRKERAQDIATYLDSNYAGYFMVAEVNHRVVGYADIKYVTQIGSAPYRVLLDELRFTSAAEEEDLHTALVSVAKLAAERLNASSVTASITKDGTQIRSLLESLDFTRAEAERWTWSRD